MIKARVRKRDGRRVYDVRLRDPNGKEYSRTFLTKKEAEAFEAGEITARNRGTWIDPRSGNLTVSEVARHWLETNPAKRTRSAETDSGALQQALPRIGQRAVGSITRADIQRLVDTWRTSYAPSTVQRMYSTVRALFSYAEAAELIDRSPCRHVRLPQAPLLKRPSISANDLDRLAQELGPDYAPMMWLAVVTGARWAECAGLTVGSLDPLRGTLTVAQQLARDRTLVSPKSAAGERTMTAPQWLLDELANLLARRGLTGADTAALVFVNSFGRPLSYSPWRRSVWLPGCERANLVGLQFHDLRRANATALVAQGVDVKTAQARLGHASPTTTLAIYARASAEADRQASEKVAGLFHPRDARGMNIPSRRRKSD